MTEKNTGNTRVLLILYMIPWPYWPNPKNYVQENNERRENNQENRAEKKTSPSAMINLM